MVQNMPLVLVSSSLVSTSCFGFFVVVVLVLHLVIDPSSSCSIFVCGLDSSSAPGSGYGSSSAPGSGYVSSSCSTSSFGYASDYGSLKFYLCI